MTDRPGLDMINKANAIISALDDHDELSAGRVAELVEEPVSSTYRLLTALSRIGWVERGSKRGLYRLGLFFMGIGGQVEDRIDIRESVLPSMRQLIATTGHTTYLCLRRGDRAVCIERLNGREIRSLAMQIGDSLPLYLGAAPRALFAFLPKSERDGLIDLYTGPTSAWPGAPAAHELRQLITETRERGYSISDGDVTPGVASVGAPVFNHRGELEGAISISNLREPILDDLDVMSSAVLSAAHDVSVLLGFEGDRSRP